jgi:glutathione S-transferase
MPIMKLRLSSTSPFARKCLIVAMEAGIESGIEQVTTAPWAAESDLPADNPLGKVPVLITDGGESIYDSPVICEYLDSLHGGRKLIPVAGGERWRHLRLEALADGITDAAVMVRIETAMRPEGLRWPHWVERQTNAVIRGLDALERDCADWGDDFLIGQIAALCAVGYVEFRKITDWRVGRPALAAWMDRMAARGSVVATEAKD